MVQKSWVTINSAFLSKTKRMRITTLECWTETLKLAEPYTIAYETIHHCTNVFLKIGTDIGITGWGCAAPDMEVTGETDATVLASFRNSIEPNLINQDPFTYSRIIFDLKTLLREHPSALAMVDMAIFDIVAKKAKEPVYRYLGGYKPCIATSITVGILSVQETLDRVIEFQSQGFFIYKIKGGVNVDEDIERIIRLREMLGDKTEIRFDANQGYTIADSLRFIEKTKDAKIELLEQPTDKDNTKLLTSLTRQTDMPIMADESLMTLKDVLHLTANNCMDMINIKLMKVGGISEAMRINAVAKAANIDTMVGCMDESAMGIAAGLHFALARPNIQYADLDGHFDMIDDPFASMVSCKKGILYPSESPGFGWGK